MQRRRVEWIPVGGCEVYANLQKEGKGPSSVASHSGTRKAYWAQKVYTFRSPHSRDNGWNRQTVWLLLFCSHAMNGREGWQAPGGEEQELGSEAIWSLHYRNRQRNLSPCKQVTVR